MRTLGVIIVSWNVRSLLDRCLASLHVALKQTDVEADVWVIDNNSDDGSAQLVAERHPWVHLVTPGRNLGFVRANNLVLKELLRTQALPDYVWLLNPDTEVPPSTPTKLIETFVREPDAGLLGPKLLNPDGSLQQSAFRFPVLLQPLFDLGWLPVRFYNSRWNGRYSDCDYAKSKPFQIDHPLGAAMMARGTAVAQVGPLDEAFVMYCEEIDWAWRMRRAGWSIWLVPQATVVHHGGASSGQARPATTTHLWESRAHLYHKYHGPLVRTLVGAAVRRHFSRREPPSPAWAEAYRRIVEAWSEP
ncbi:MAG: glycosyltransferase family 2 protein [Anaerolineae bacterium]